MIRPELHLAERVATVNRTFTLEQTLQEGRTVWTINGQLYDPARVDAMPHLNTTEIWTFRTIRAKRIRCISTTSNGRFST